MWNFICLHAYTYVYECMHVSVFIGNNARKYASQLPSHLKTYTYIHTDMYCMCLCTHIFYNYVCTTNSATKKYFSVYRSLFQLILM